MGRVRRADVAIVGDGQRLVELLELRHVLVADVDGLDALLFSGVGDLLAVLVGAREEVHLAAVRAVVAADDVGGDGLIRMPHVRRAVGIVDRGGQVEFLVLPGWDRLGAGDLRLRRGGGLWRGGLAVLLVLGSLGLGLVGGGLRRVHLGLAAVRDEEEHRRGVRSLVRPVADVVALALELHNLALLDVADVRVGHCRLLDPGLRRVVDVGLELGGVVAGLVVEVLAHQMVQRHELHGDEVLDVSEPSQLLGLLLVALQVQLAGEAGLAAAAEDDVAPGHERHLLTLRVEGAGVGRLDQQVAREACDLVAERRVLLVLRHALELDLLRAIGDVQLHHSRRAERGVARHLRVDHLLVDRPDLVPGLVRDVLRRTLRQDVLLQSLDGQATAGDALDGRDTRVIPAVDVALVNEPLDLALGEHALLEVEAGELPDVDLAEVHDLLEVLEHRVAVDVLAVTERMSDAIVGVDNRAGEVVGRVDLELGTGARVRCEVHTVQARVAQTLVQALHVHAHARHAFLALRRSLLHLRPQGLVLRDGVLSKTRASQSIMAFQGSQ